MSGPEGCYTSEEVSQLRVCESSVAILDGAIFLGLLASGVGIPVAMKVIWHCRLPRGFVLGLLVTLALEFLWMFPRVGALAWDWASCSNHPGMLSKLSRNLATTDLFANFLDLFGTFALVTSMVSGFLFLRTGRIISGLYTAVGLAFAGVGLFIFVLPKALAFTTENHPMCDGGMYRQIIITQIGNSSAMSGYYIAYDVVRSAVPGSIMWLLLAGITTYTATLKKGSTGEAQNHPNLGGGSESDHLLAEKDEDMGELVTRLARWVTGVLGGLWSLYALLILLQYAVDIPDYKSSLVLQSFTDTVQDLANLALPWILIALRGDFQGGCD